FAKTGDPNEPENPILSTYWSASTSESSHYIEFGDTIQAKDGSIKRERSKFWNDYIGKLLTNAQCSLNSVENGDKEEECVKPGTTNVGIAVEAAKALVLGMAFLGTFWY
ncbi:unnamed protein product, partial [Owenia fusiformis]